MQDMTEYGILITALTKVFDAISRAAANCERGTFKIAHSKLLGWDNFDASFINHFLI